MTWRSWFHDHFLGQIIKQTIWPQQLWMKCVTYHLTRILLFIVWFLFQVISLGKMGPGSLHESLTVLVSIWLPLFIIRMSILQPYEVLQPSIQCPFVSLGGSCLLISPIIGISQSLCFYANLSERWVSHFKSLFFNSHITHLCIFANSSHSGKSGQALFSVMVTDSPIWVTKCSLKHGIFAMSLGSRSSPRVYPLPFVFTCQLQWCTGGNHKIASDNGLLNIQKFCNPVVKPLIAWKLGFLMALTVKNLPAMQKTWVWSLGIEDSLEKGWAAHFSILAWRIPWTEEPGGLLSMGSQRVRHNWSDIVCTDKYICLCQWSAIIQIAGKLAHDIRKYLIYMPTLHIH